MGSAEHGRGGIAWRRYALIAVPAVVLAGLTVALVGQGALAASFAVSGASFKLSAATLDGTGFASYTSVDTGADGERHAVTPAGFTTADLKDLCQSVVSKTPFGPVTMRLTAGKTEPVKATNLVADFDNLQGDITFGTYASGVSAADLKGGTTGPAGQWGQQAATIHIDNLKQNTWATTAATFALKGLNIDVAFGTKECY
jgi:hypothetical protein